MPSLRGGGIPNVKLAEKLSRAAGAGMTVRRSDVLRRALEVGLATLEEGGEDTYTSKGGGS